MSNAQAIIDAVRESNEAQEVEPGAILLVTMRDGSRGILDTDQYAVWPRRTQRSVTFADPAHFVDYVNRHDATRTELWADEATGAMVAILDAPDGGPGWCGHRATLKLQQTPEWLAWTAASGVLSKQEAFAEFIEDRLADIVRPEGAIMLELAQSFQANSKASFESSRFLADGRRALEFREDVEARAGRKGEIEIPATFDLGLRPFVGCDPYKVVARLRYRIGDGHLSIGFKLNQPEDVVRAAFADVASAVSAGAPTDVWFGKP